MSLSTICPKCQEMFHISSDSITSIDGRVRCGNCDNIFVALKHAVLMDAPIVNENIDKIILVKKKNYFFFKFLLIILLLILLGSSFVYFIKYSLLKGNILTEEQTSALMNYQQLLDLKVKPINTLKHISLNDILLIKQDNSIKLTFYVKNDNNYPVSNPNIRIVLLDLNNQPLYQNVEKLSVFTKKDSLLPNSNEYIDSSIKTESDVINYKISLEPSN